MRTSDYDYELPSALIAQHPLARRDRSRLLVVRRTANSLEHRRFDELPTLLSPGDLLVLNNTRVIPARVLGRKESGGRVELLFTEPLCDRRWRVLMRASRRPGPGEPIILSDGGDAARVVSHGERGEAVVDVKCEGSVFDLLDRLGAPPLPPYIRRRGEPGESAEDATRYQTLYAKEPGAVAAPTAGLHFTPEVFAACEARGIGRAEITLHVGPGTFRPVSAERVEDHRMEEERYRISPEAAGAIRDARRRGGRVVAVGSTSVRTLETAARDADGIRACEGRSDLFIRPPFSFRAVDAMLTNFHLPRSTLLMMVAALAGRDLILRAYREAIQERYRFYSYGDAMLIL
jgi:S-adenosylmethionine:tRNA ribosyltransferase-isomerase